MSATFVHAAGLVAVAGVFGAMVFFAFVYAPLVFIKLPISFAFRAMNGNGAAKPLVAWRRRWPAWRTRRAAAH